MINKSGVIEIDFNNIIPEDNIRRKMKSVKYRWNPNKMIWWAYENNETIAMAKEICGESEPDKSDEEVFPKTCGLKVKIKDIVNANGQFRKWVERLCKYVEKIMTEDNARLENWV